MDKLISIDDERVWNILFDEACVEGQQADRIYKALEAIAEPATFDKENVIEELKSWAKASHEAGIRSSYAGLGSKAREYYQESRAYIRASKIVEKAWNKRAGEDGVEE